MKSSQNKTGLSQFQKLCQCLSLKEIEEVFRLFFTFEELEHIGARYLIIRDLLQNEISQREIANNLNVSISQITRGSNALKEMNGPLIKKLTTFTKE